MSKAQLKRCPFCDGTAILIQNPTIYGNVYHYVSCIECGNRTKLYKSPKTAEKKWNRRNDEEIIIISRAEIDALNEYEEMIKKAKVIMPDVAEGKWIPVEERLPDPKEYDWVLVNVMFNEDGTFGVPHISECRDGEWYGTDDLLKDLQLTVTHWMPLPEPPKGVLG